MNNDLCNKNQILYEHEFLLLKKFHINLKYLRLLNIAVLV